MDSRVRGIVEGYAAEAGIEVTLTDAIVRVRGELNARTDESEVKKAVAKAKGEIGQRLMAGCPDRRFLHRKQGGRRFWNTGFRHMGRFCVNGIAAGIECVLSEEERNNMLRGIRPL